MKVFMTGGTGFVGTNLTNKLVEKGHRLTLLTRKIREKHPLPPGADYVEGDPTRPGPWQDRVAEHEVIINLAGTSIFRRWTSPAKKAILESRTRTTQNLVDALSARKGLNTHFFSTSAVGYYGFRGDEDLDEDSPPGEDFLASLSVEWETCAMKAETHGARVVPLRFGIVLGKEGGALKQMIPLFKSYLGSPLGSGKQWFSWIHMEDLTSIYLFLLEKQDIAGPINCTSPNPVRNRELTKVIGEVLGKPTLMPAVPAFAMKMILGEFGSVLIKGQKVIPKRLLDKGFRFHFPLLKGALQDLLG
jgi:uncharacterized protein (TIGR01777 family)